VIQVNGKHRGELLVPPGTAEAEAVALARTHPKAGPHLAGRTVKKIIYVPNRILNFVVLEAPQDT
jgi:leucyl-tRNA synthetase